MKKIILSVAIVSAAAAIVIGGSIAYFSDTETSTGNTFTAGAIDLTIDNESYAIDFTIPDYSNPTGALVKSVNTSWALSDLDNQVFFNFVDLKPGDFGEDTISIHVNNNDAWMCMSTEITATPENGITEPEGIVDSSDGIDEGELQDELNFAFWVDDGDNVLEVDESAQVWQGTAEEFMNTSPRIIADSTFNIFGQTAGTPVKGDTEFYIAKAWCFGELGLDPQSEAGTNPVARGVTGITCDGASVDNSTQTDGIVGNITFYAEQARNNENFTCASLNQQPTRYTGNSLSYNATGWAGHSCPTDYLVVGGGVLGATSSVIQGMAKSGVTVSGSTYPNYPHYNYTLSEEGWVVQNGGTPQTMTIYVDCVPAP